MDDETAGDETGRHGPRERRAALLGLMREGVTQVHDLASRVGVSASTVRRDLTRLTAAGEVARTYGGAIHTDVFQERPIGESSQIAQRAKADIARTALELVPSSGQVFVDAGSTCGALARCLSASVAHTGLSVVTRGLETASALADADQLVVHVLGGRIRPLSHGLVGPLTDLALDRLAFDVAFLGADAVAFGRGIGEPTLEETTVKERVAARARRVVVLADATKLAEVATPAWTHLPSGWSLITDAAAPACLETEAVLAGVELVRASEAISSRL